MKKSKKPQEEVLETCADIKAYFTSLAANGNYYGADYQKADVSYEMVLKLTSLCVSMVEVQRLHEKEIAELKDYIEGNNSRHIYKKGIGHAKGI